MSLKLDAVAYRNKTDYRIKRLEHIAMVTYLLEKDYWPSKEDKRQMWEYLEELRKEHANASKDN